MRLDNSVFRATNTSFHNYFLLLSIIGVRPTNDLQNRLSKTTLKKSSLLRPNMSNNKASDSNYIAVTRWRRPYSTTPPVWLDDDAWRTTPALDADDDLVDVQKYESAVAPLLEEGELDADAIVVTPAGNSSAAANHAVERRRREERWTELGLEQLLQQQQGNAAVGATRNARNNPSTPSATS